MPGPREASEEILALVRRALWRALGRDPGQTKAAVEFPEGLWAFLDVASLLPEDQLAQITIEVDLREVALDIRTIWSVSNNDCAECEEAFDFGDGFYYVAYTLTEVANGRLRAAVPKELAENEFMRLRSRLKYAELLTAGFWQPTSVDGFDLSQPVSLRTIASALDQGEFARHVFEDIYGVEWLGDETPEADGVVAGNTEAIRALWQAAVRCQPQVDSLPPGFAILVERSRPFEEWLGRATVRWADTGNRLKPTEVAALRMTCLFLAQA